MHIHKWTCVHMYAHMHMHLPFALVNTVQCKALTYSVMFRSPCLVFSSQEKARRCFPLGHSEGPGSSLRPHSNSTVWMDPSASPATTHGVWVVFSALQYKRCCEQPRSL